MDATNFLPRSKVIFLSPPIHQEFQEKSHFHPWLLLIFLRPPQPRYNSTRHPKLNQIENPLHHGYLGNKKARLKRLSIHEKLHANENRITKKTYASTMHLERNREITYATCYLQSILVVFVDPTFFSIFLWLFSCSFLTFSKSKWMLECSKNSPSVQECKREKLKLTKRCELILWYLFIINV